MNAQIEVIAEHSVLFPVTGPVLDVGCRSFNFSKELARRGHYVVALDPDPTIQEPELVDVKFMRYALWGKDGSWPMGFKMDKDPQARRLDANGEITVTTVDIKMLMNMLGIGSWGLVKLDCEGAEYEILMNWPGPIAKQITVEFHEHVSPRAPELYEEIFKRLGKWYDVVQHEKSMRHCLSTPNYWDSLFVLRGQ